MENLEPTSFALLLTVFAVLIAASAVLSQASERAGVPVVLLFLVLGMLAGREGIGIWESRTATEAPRSANMRAAETPVNAAPTTTTSVRDGSSAGGGSNALAVARQYDCASSSILEAFSRYSTLFRSRLLARLPSA
jgi:flagellar basal body-associated protein FliL